MTRPRQYAALGAGRLRMTELVPRLVDRLSDAQPAVRMSAAAALRRVEPAAVHEHRAAILRAQQSEPEKNVRDEIERVLAADPLEKGDATVR